MENPLQEERSALDFSVFSWFLALSVLFQLARGDMGLFPGLRNTPNGWTFGDGAVPQVWFCCALITLVYPDKVWSLVLLCAAGVFDFWWRLPTVTPSIYFQAFISAQVIVTAGYLLMRRRNWRISPAEFVDSIRTPVLGLMIGLFFFAGFHKLTWQARIDSSGFLQLIAGYYLPFLPVWRFPKALMWLLTIGGELLIAFTLLFRRARPIGIVLCVGFACFVGSVVYGFGAIVLAAVMPLATTHLIFEPLSGLALTKFLKQRVTARVWRLAFMTVIGALFCLDHVKGFTLADRTWLFTPGKQPKTADVLTLMQWVWFILSTSVLVCALVSWCRHRATLAARISFSRTTIAYMLPLFLAVSEIGLYTGLKDSPGFTMFAGLKVKSCFPNHYLVKDRLLSSFFHRDLILVTTPRGQRIGIPALSLRAKWDRAQGHGVSDPLVEAYRSPTASRLHGAVEEPFKSLRDLFPAPWGVKCSGERVYT